MTGIKAAQILHDNNMDDFIIIEGADYVGGRVKHETFAGQTVELGAQWVVPGYTEIVDLVLREWELETYPMDWDSVVLRDAENGLAVPDSEADPSWDKFSDAIDTIKVVAQDIVDKGKADMSAKAALRIGGWIAKTPLEKIMEWFSYDFETGQRSDVTSLLSMAFIEYNEDVHIMTDPRGYSAMFDKIAPFLSTPEYVNHTRLNQRIQRIDYDSNNNDGLVRVYCDDGTVYTADYALVTFSLGVLQSDLVEFTPKLPDWKIEELYQMHMSAYGKIFMKFTEKFWGDEQNILHVNKRYNFYPYFINFDAFGGLPADTHILIANVIGDDAWRIEYQSEEETKREVETVLQEMYGLSSPPNATEFRVHTEWLQNPLTMGAYSDWPVEVSQECFPRLQSRVGPWFFGGEATHEKYNGYVLGALMSGEREAFKILDCMADGDKCPEYVPPPNCDACDTAAETVATFANILMMVVMYLILKN